jgi:hypothetical protein
MAIERMLVQGNGSHISEDISPFTRSGYRHHSSDPHPMAQATNIRTEYADFDEIWNVLQVVTFFGPPTRHFDRVEIGRIGHRWFYCANGLALKEDDAVVLMLGLGFLSTGPQGWGHVFQGDLTQLVGEWCYHVAEEHRNFTPFKVME